MLQAEIRAALGKRTSLGELDTRTLDTQNLYSAFSGMRETCTGSLNLTPIQGAVP